MSIYLHFYYPNHKNCPNYTKQGFYEKRLEKLGIMNDKAFTCTCYVDGMKITVKDGGIVEVE